MNQGHKKMAKIQDFVFLVAQTEVLEAETQKTEAILTRCCRVAQMGHA